MTKRIICLLLCLLLAFSTAGCAIAAAAVKKGDSGAEVKKIQRLLSDWGYYSGAVDGIYGSSTVAAVIKFQKKHGITADGIVGDQTAKKLGISLSSGSSGSSGSSDSDRTDKGDVYLLAKAIYGEARGESYRGMVAVGAVILNRVKSAKFPNSISGVIYQSGAFSVVSDGQINLSPNDQALNAAKDAMNGWDPTGGSLYYYNPSKTSNKWMHSLPVAVTIGSHVFSKGN